MWDILGGAALVFMRGAYLEVGPAAGLLQSHGDAGLLQRPRLSPRGSALLLTRNPHVFEISSLM